MQDKTLDALVEALIPIVFGPPIRRVQRRKVIRLPKRPGSTVAVADHWRTAALPIARATASSSPAVPVHSPTG